MGMIGRGVQGGHIPPGPGGVYNPREGKHVPPKGIQIGSANRNRFRGRYPNIRRPALGRSIDENNPDLIRKPASGIDGSEMSIPEVPVGPTFTRVNSLPTNRETGTEELEFGSLGFNITGDPSKILKALTLCVLF